MPECLDDFIDESNPVRVIDAFVDALDLAEMGFEGVEPAATGRPSYHPNAPRALSEGFRGGSMSICSKKCSGALMQTLKRCAGVGKRSSIRSAR